MRLRSTRAVNKMSRTTFCTVGRKLTHRARSRRTNKKNWIWSQLIPRTVATTEAPCSPASSRGKRTLSLLIPLLSRTGSSSTLPPEYFIRINRYSEISFSLFSSCRTPIIFILTSLKLT